MSKLLKFKLIKFYSYGSRIKPTLYFQILEQSTLLKKLSTRNDIEWNLDELSIKVCNSIEMQHNGVFLRGDITNDNFKVATKEFQTDEDLTNYYNRLINSFKRINRLNEEGYFN